MGKKKSEIFGFESLMRVCSTDRMGLLDQSFLCQSVGLLDPAAPICVGEEAPIDGALQHLKDNSIGCVLVVDGRGVLCGIFTERDAVTKILGCGLDLSKTPVAEFMTREPVAEPADIPMAYALNLMSAGGFRHLPIIDSERKPIGIISIKDIVDFIVNRLGEDLLAIDTTVGN